MSILPLLVALLSLNPQYISKGKEAKVECLVAFYGTESLVQQPDVLRVTSASQWQSVLARHYGTEVSGDVRVSDDTNLGADTININWGACMVLAIFDGTVRNSKGLRFDGLDNVGETLTVRLSRRMEAGEGHSVLVNPYAFLVMTRTKKEIRVQMQGPNGKDDYRTVASLAAIKD